jgi:hypothetical protein
MSNGIGKEHPYQRIIDGKSAARLALDEVMKINDTASPDVESEYDINYIFGSWYMAFLNIRRDAMLQGRVFTREDGEAEIEEFFSPVRVRERWDVLRAFLDLAERKYALREVVEGAQKLTAAIVLLAEAIPDDKGFAALKDYATSYWEKIRMLQDMLQLVGANAPENTTSVTSFTS